MPTKTDSSNFNKNTDTAYNAKKTSVVFEKLPEDLNELKMICDDFNDPSKIAADVIAVLSSFNTNKENCIEMLNYLRGPRPVDEYEIEYIGERLRIFPYLIESYFDGATAENNYKPTIPYTVSVYEPEVNEIIVGEGFMRLFLKSGGANSARGVKLRYKASSLQWFIWDYLIFADIERPTSENPWA